MTEIGIAAAGVNRKLDAAGKKWPKNEGPRSRPAMISPTAPGCSIHAGSAAVLAYRYGAYGSSAALAVPPRRSSRHDRRGHRGHCCARYQAIVAPENRDRCEYRRHLRVVRPRALRDVRRHL